MPLCRFDLNRSSSSGCPEFVRVMYVSLCVLLGERSAQSAQTWFLPASISSSSSAPSRSVFSWHSGSTTIKKSRTVSSTRRTVSTARTSHTRAASCSLHPCLRSTLLQLARKAISPKHAPLRSSDSTLPSSSACACPTSAQPAMSAPSVAQGVQARAAAERDGSYRGNTC